MKGDRKFLVAVLYGVGMIAALVLIIVLKQFTPENFKVWLGALGGMFTLYNAANVVSKFSPEATNGKEEEKPEASPASGGKRKGLFGKMIKGK
jgi:hypothetical protein